MGPVTSQPSSNHVVQSCCCPPLRSKLPRRTPRCRYWRGKLCCCAFQGTGREVAPGMPSFSPLLLRIWVLPTRGKLARRSFQGLQWCEQRPPSCPCSCPCGRCACCSCRCCSPCRSCRRCCWQCLHCRCPSCHLCPWRHLQHPVRRLRWSCLSRLRCQRSLRRCPCRCLCCCPCPCCCLCHPRSACCHLCRPLLS